MNAVAEDFLAPIRQWRVWWLLGAQDIRMRYRRSAIGPFWISLSMATLVIGIGFLYSGIFSLEFKPYLAWLATSFLVWNVVSAALIEGCGALVDAESHLKSSRIAVPLYAARVAWRTTLVFLHNLLVIMLVLLYCDVETGFTVLLAAPGYLLLTAFVFLASVIMGPLTLRFRDVKQIMASIVQIMFFVTPIIWMPDQGRVPSLMIEGNPLYHLIEIVRAPLLGTPPTLLNWSVSIAMIAAMTLLALLSDAMSRRKVFLWL
ncbi:MAG: ABC transporter permease [Parvularcula sp.]|nr:ABC transporter permease [Parvularcula sp.]